MPECLKVYAKDERMERLIGDRKELMKIYGRLEQPRYRDVSRG